MTWSVVLLLVGFNVVAHFLPFERAALAPDDYANLVRSRDKGLTTLVASAMKFPDRPLHHIVVLGQSKLVGDNPTIGLFLVVLSSTFVLLAAYFLLDLLLANRPMAVIGSVLFCLVPNKLETYHTPIYFNINTVIGLYLVSFILFVLFARRRRPVLLLGSVAAYSAGVFWYEVGFFLPVAMATYAWLFARGAEKYALYMGIPATSYAAYRITGGFGLAEAGAVTHQLGVSNLHMVGMNVLDLAHHYLGRYMARSVVYGLYNFPAVERPWLAVLIASDALLLGVFAFYIWQMHFPAMERRAAVLATVIFLAGVTPILLNEVGGVGGRHLVLPSVGVVIFALWLLTTIERAWRPALLAIVGVGLIVSQGNAWAQVVASRINGAVYEALREQRDALLGAERVVIDTRSFADRIPFTMVHRDFNVLNTYYGAQAFEGWGLRSMVRLALGRSAGVKEILIATERPRPVGEAQLEIVVSRSDGYRSVSRDTRVIPALRTVVVDFNAVFGDRYRDGLRARSEQTERGR